MIGLLLATAFGDPRLLGPLALDEVSGVAVGVHGTYVQEDSGNDPVVRRVDSAGRDVATLRLPVRNRDWEDLAATPDGSGTPSLWVADIGDNRSVRHEVQVHRFAEPAGDHVGPVTTYRFAYADGPHDAEALLVLPGGLRVAVVTKGLTGAGVYEGPLDASAPQVLQRVADVEVRVTGTRGGPAGAFGQLLVTGGAVAPDGRTVALRTYTDLYEWDLTDDLAATFAAAPVVSALPPTGQGEAVGYGRDSRSVLVAGEGEGAPLQQLTRTGPPSPTATPTLPATRPRTPATTAAREGDGSGRLLAALVATVVLGAAGLVGLARTRRPRRRGPG